MRKLEESRLEKFNDVIILPPRERNWKMTHHELKWEGTYHRWVMRWRIRIMWVREEKILSHSGAISSDFKAQLTRFDQGWLFGKKKWKYQKNDDKRRFWQESEVRKSTAQAGDHVGPKILKRDFELYRAVRFQFWSRKWIQDGRFSQGWSFYANWSTFKN